MPSRTRASSTRSAETRSGWLFTAPVIVVLGLFLVLPIVIVFPLSFSFPLPHGSTEIVAVTKSVSGTAGPTLYIASSYGTYASHTPPALLYSGPAYGVLIACSSSPYAQLPGDGGRYLSPYFGTGGAAQPAGPV